jgi:arsenite methyltransferase
VGDHPLRTNAAAGQFGTEAGFLDAHFEACRPEYEAMLRSVGLQPGWSVLDAACGGGSYLPLLADLVGPRGAIAAFDLAQDSVDRVERLAAAGAFGCPVEARVAALTTLPYPDGAFDAVWCANSLEYLLDGEFATALAEFRRVVRPGGLVAVKDADPGLFLFAPGDPGLLLRTFVALAAVGPPFAGGLRARTTRRWLERLGLVDVWQRATLSELWAPLTPVQRHYLGRGLMELGALAERVDLPEADQAFWRRQRNPEAADALVNDPDFFWCEGHFVAVGRVPVPLAYAAAPRQHQGPGASRRTFAGLHFLAFACLMLHRLLTVAAQSP